MRVPYFSRREVLLFLRDNASSIEADSESKCWRAAWEGFSGGMLDPHDGPRLAFERECSYLGYSPHVDANGVYRLRYYSFEAEFAR